MKIIGPDRYKLTFDVRSFTVLCMKGTAKFYGIATSHPDFERFNHVLKRDDAKARRPVAPR